MRRPAKAKEAQSEERAETAGPRHGSNRTSDGMRVKKRVGGKRREWRAERLHGRAQMEARKRNKDYSFRDGASAQIRSGKRRGKEDEHGSLQFNDKLAADAEEAVEYGRGI